MMTLDRKLTRDLVRLKGQVLAIALVVASGVALLMMSLGTMRALDEMARIYYERYAFAHVFAGLERAPMDLAQRIAAIPGVQIVEPRISKFALLEIEGFDEPVTGKLVSVSEAGGSLLNRLALRRGRSVLAGHPNEVVLSEPFADAHGLEPGDSLDAVMDGRLRTLDIVGIALSPEFVYAMAPGSLMPDDERFGILWMGRAALEAAYDLDGAFNDVTLTLLKGTPPKRVIAELDEILERYGGVGAIERADQISNWFLMNEIHQQRTISTILPTIFLLVAAFLANMVMARLVATERSEIGLLKAFGYTNAAITLHYVKMIAVITIIGVVLGWLAGTWLGRFNTELYAEHYRFPFLYFRPGIGTYVLGAVISILAVTGGAVFAALDAARLPPAEAMRPPAPTSFRRSALSATWLARFLDEATRIIIRQIARRPGRTSISVVGVALSVAVLILALQWVDAITEIVYSHFFSSQHHNVVVGLANARPVTVTNDFRRMPGVLAAEPARIVSADFRAGARFHRGSVEGVARDARLQPVYDVRQGEMAMPADGIVMSAMLAEKLGVGIGDSVEVSLHEGRRPVVRLTVAMTFETHIGMPAYVDLARLSRMLGERPAAQSIQLLVDTAHQAKLFRKLKDIPQVSAVTLKRAAIDEFNTTMADTVLIFVGFFAAFACTLTFGVVYNATRIALSERGRELATLRVLGFSRGEIAYILLGELGIVVLLGLPLGCVMGDRLSHLVNRAFASELFRIPEVIEPATFGTAVVIAFAASAVSAALVGNRLRHLDLMAVLKSRE